MANETKVLSSKEANEEFLKLRNRIDKLIEQTPPDQLDEVFAEEFGKIYTDAVLGDLVAQDYLGYIFKRGKDNLVPENIEISMKWQILAAANGNNLSIDRLQIFLNFAYDEIVYQDDFAMIKYKNDLDENNYTYIIGRLICEAIVDDLQIKPLEIIKDVPDVLPFNSASMRVFDMARNRAIKIVLRYLRGYSPKDENADVVKEKPIFDQAGEEDFKELSKEKSKQEKKPLFKRIFNKKEKSEKENKDENQ